MPNVYGCFFVFLVCNFLFLVQGLVLVSLKLSEKQENIYKFFYSYGIIRIFATEEYWLKPNDYEEWK